jgi:hypothetical protein
LHADLYRGVLVDEVVPEENWSEWTTAQRARLMDLALGAFLGLPSRRPAVVKKR